MITNKKTYPLLRHTIGHSVSGCFCRYKLRIMVCPVFNPQKTTYADVITVITR